MARRPNFGYEKRQKEMKKQQKKEEKAERKRLRREAGAGAGEETGLDGAEEPEARDGGTTGEA